jgi:hypothetical protein
VVGIKTGGISAVNGLIWEEGAVLLFRFSLVNVGNMAVVAYGYQF